jgi:YidC/Oxa1 family membrane protein insertase
VLGEIGYLFNIIFTNPIFNALMVLYHLFGDFGLAIVILTVFIKLILFPLTLQQLKSMKANQVLQPKMAEIKKKYAHNQQEQMMAMQALYKEHGFNPAAGCLPMVIQLPVLYGLFYALEFVVSNKTSLANINSRLYSFVQPFAHMPNTNLEWFTFLNPHWYISLAQPHNVVLAILAGAVTFVQLRMSQVRNAGKTPASSDPTAQSMKMMQYVMPFMTVFFAWEFASGLALYWIVSYAFQAIQQYFVTGWGDLLTVPNLKNGLALAGSSDNKVVEAKSTSSESRQRERPSQKRVTVPPTETSEISESSTDTDTVTNEEAIESRPRTETRGSGPSQYNRRRQRGSSASARRRSGAQRSRG